MTTRALFAPYRLFMITLSVLLFSPALAEAQGDPAQVEQLKSQVEQLKELVASLQSRITALERRNGFTESTRASGPDDAAALATAASELRGPTTQTASTLPAPPTTQTVTPASATLPSTLPGEATLNYYFDGYFENNFNNPTGRVNDLRAYDVLSRVFSINQADIILALDPDVPAGRRDDLAPRMRIS